LRSWPLTLFKEVKLLLFSFFLLDSAHWGYCCTVLHLHSHGVIHRDISARNLLMDAHGNIKIGGAVWHDQASLKGLITFFFFLWGRQTLD
jgi:hypothetical protein